MITLFLSQKEIKNIKSFFEGLKDDANKYFDFENGSIYCGRHYVDVIGEHELIKPEEHGVWIKGCGTFYVEDED